MDNYPITLAAHLKRSEREYLLRLVELKLTIAQQAKLAGFSRQYLYVLLKKHDIPYLRDKTHKQGVAAILNKWTRRAEHV